MEREIKTLQQSSKVLFGNCSPTNAAPLAMDWFASQPVSDHINLDLPIWARVSNIRNRILSIDGPEAGKLRVRRPVTRSGAHNRWKTPSWKMQRMIHCESEHERNVVRLLDFLPDVLQIHEQPARIAYCIDGVKHTHVPDLLVVTKFGKEFWEIKLASSAAKEELRLRTDFMSHQLPTRGFSYRLIIADDLARNPRMENISLMLRLGCQDIPLREREFLRQVLNRTDITWGQAIGQAFGPYSARHICRLVLEGALRFNVDAPLTESTVFESTMGQR